MVDYSKWDHIEVSDDEDDTHPNIDTPSLFRWRHKARVERMEEQKKERQEVEQGTEKCENMQEVDSDSSSSEEVELRSPSPSESFDLGVQPLASTPRHGNVSSLQGSAQAACDAGDEDDADDGHLASDEGSSMEEPEDADGSSIEEQEDTAHGSPQDSDDTGSFGINLSSLTVHDATASETEELKEDSSSSYDINRLNWSVDYIEKGDYIYLQEKIEDDENDSDYELDACMKKGGKRIEKLPKISVAQAVFGEEPDESDRDSDVMTRSGLHKKVSADEASAAEFFVISKDRLHALAAEALSKCPRCNKPTNPTVSAANGTAAHVTWICPEGHSKMFCTQETIERSHIGDLRIGSSILLSGNNFEKIKLLAKFAKLNFISGATYSKIQGNYVIPAVEAHWKEVRTASVARHTGEDVIVCGDARNDSPGFSAQYCTYTFMEFRSSDVLHVGFKDKRQTAMKSPTMEIEAFKEGLAALQESNLDVKEVVTDAHSSISKYMREEKSGMSHSWDVWHGAKNLSKKLNKVASKSAVRPLQYWIDHIVGHFWHCSKTCGANFNLFMAKWRGLVHHITNQHEWVSSHDHGPSRCEHDPLPPELQEREQYLTPGDAAHLAAISVCLDKKFKENIRRYIHYRHTGMLESMHNHILMYASKRFSFQYPAYTARNLLAVIDFMAHKDRADVRDAEGKIKVRHSLEDTRQLLENLKTKGDEEGAKKAESKLKELESEEKKWREKEAEIEKKEKLTPWNVDTLSKPGFEKTVINTYEKTEDEMTEEEKENKMESFVKKNEKLIKEFGMYSRNNDAQRFLIDHPNLVCEETANYLAIWCINLEVEEKHGLMEQVAHQTIIMQYLLELAKSLDRDPRSCIRPFFAKMDKAEKQYQDAFDDELESFKNRVRERAKARIDRAYKEAEEEMEKERQARLGPGGLDPAEVFETLPKELQDCFESKSISQLQETIAKMDPADAQYHMKRCVDSGLWVPGGGEKDAAEGEEGGATAEAEEEVYEEIDKETNLDAVD